MPCVIILRDRSFDIIVYTDDDGKIQDLCDFAIQMDASDEDPVLMNINILKNTQEFSITPGCVFFRDEADIYRKFPNREIPMRLSFEEANDADWSQGIVCAGIRYFGAKARDLGENQQLPQVAGNQNVFHDFNILKQYMSFVADHQ